MQIVKRLVTRSVGQPRVGCRVAVLHAACLAMRLGVRLGVLGAVAVRGGAWSRCCGNDLAGILAKCLPGQATLG